MSLTFAVEPFETAIEAISPYWSAHWQEVGIHKDSIPLDVDLDFYRTLDTAGMLHIIVARDGETAVGYMVWVVKVHPRYRSSLTGIAEVFWLHPSYRKGRNGLAMFQWAERYLADLGVDRLFGSCKVEHNLSSLYLGLGWTHHELLFTKLLR